jgi:hypothetical protein
MAAGGNAIALTAPVPLVDPVLGGIAASSNNLLSAWQFVALIIVLHAADRTAGAPPLPHAASPANATNHSRLSLPTRRPGQNRRTGYPIDFGNAGGARQDQDRTEIGLLI